MHLALHQPMLRFGNRSRDAVRLAFSVIDRLRRHLPAWSSRQFDREHPSGLTPVHSHLADTRVLEGENSQSPRRSSAERRRDDGGQYDQESQDQQQCRGPLLEYVRAV